MTDAAKFITNITRLNLLYQAAKLLLRQIDKGHLVDDHGHDFNWNRELIDFRRAVQDAEKVGWRCTSS
jgi:hypothetical protein